MQNRSHEKNRKDEGPGCACGKRDLYEDWLKNGKENKEAPGENSSDHTEESSKSSDPSVKEN